MCYVCQICNQLFCVYNNVFVCIITFTYVLFSLPVYYLWFICILWWFLCNFFYYLCSIWLRSLNLCVLDLQFELVPANDKKNALIGSVRRETWKQASERSPKEGKKKRNRTTFFIHQASEKKNHAPIEYSGKPSHEPVRNRGRKDPTHSIPRKLAIINYW